MAARSRELITTQEPTAIAKFVFDVNVMEDGECNKRFPDTLCIDQSDGSKFSASLMTPLMRASCPKRALGGGGGSSPGEML